MPAGAALALCGAVLAHRKSSPPLPVPDLARAPFAVALRRTFAQGYSRDRLRRDALAGVVVAIVALPLSMALAIAVGVPPQQGLYTTIVAGAVVALAGGSKHQVTGPTAAFVVVLAPITAKFGLPGLLTAGLMAGGILVAMGVLRLGRLVEYIPHPVTTGFTAGIALVIATMQVKDVLGLPVARMPDGYFEKVAALWDARGAASLSELGVAAGTLVLLLAWPRVTRALPSPLVAIGLVTVAVSAASHAWPGFHVATLGSRFHSVVGGRLVAGIPQAPPLPVMPWGADLSFGRLRELFPAALAIAMLGAIESLLSAVIADAMTGKKHDPDAELVGLGLGNIVAPFFGGIAATGALARTATNVRAGATSPIASVVHALAVLVVVLVAAPLVAYVPMAALAALLLLVAWNMSDARHVAHTLRVAPRSDVAVLLTCFVLTVVFDMVVAIGVGVVLAALLFMRRMSALTHTRALGSPETEDAAGRTLPEGVAVYEVAGPLFFGAAQRAMGALDTVGVGVRAVVLSLAAVPTIDATGLVALESALQRLHAAKRLVVIAGPLPEPRSVFESADLEVAHDHVFLTDSLEEGIQLARDLIVLSPQGRGGSSPPPSIGG
ncbi:MAG TPA: C4-dicarboxylic acid transporter DauA [Polyangiaceae bacterium]|jgi:SulP family sulfate permease